MTMTAPLRTKTFWKHYAEMVAAMFAGMLVLTPVANLLLGRPMFGMAMEPVVAASLLMATTMALGMTAWMAFRGHSWRSIAWMAAAMYVPFLILFPPYWAGWLAGDAVMTIGHVLMLPAMAAVMLRR